MPVKLVLKRIIRELKSDITKLFTNAYDADNFSGYVYVTKNNKVVFDKAYGKADFEAVTDITRKTKFEICSIYSWISPWKRYNDSFMV